MEKAAFEGWLESVSTAFLTLNDQQRNQSLDHLISLSGAAQLRHLSNGLETLLKRDFLRLLPLELAFYLIRWLDPQTLLTCCLVCKQWNKVNRTSWSLVVQLLATSHSFHLHCLFISYYFLCICLYVRVHSAHAQVVDVKAKSEVILEGCLSSHPS